MTPRKPPVKRAFTGLVGAPYEPGDTPQEPATPAPVEAAPTQARRGRPPIGEKAMTSTESSRASRNKQAIADALADNADSKGRLPGERSGEADRKFGMSEVEMIHNARVRDEDGARRVKPAGARSDVELSAAKTPRHIGIIDEAGRKPYRPGPEDWKEMHRAEDEMILRVMWWAFLPTTNGDGNYFCRRCMFTTNSAQAACDHIEEALAELTKQQEHFVTLTAPDMADVVPPSFVKDAGRRIMENPHHVLLLVRKERAKRKQ